MRRIIPLSAVVVLLSAVAARADDQADAKALLDKAIKAHGGADAISKVKAATVTFKGKFYGMGEGIDYTGSVAYQTPDKSRIEIEVVISDVKFRSIIVVNKDKGWIANNDKVSAMDKDTIAERLEEQHANNLTSLNPALFKDAKLSLVGEVKVANKPATGMRVEVKGKRDVTLYFDKETNLLVKSERRGKDVEGGGGEFGEEQFFSDFKEVSGVKFPYKVTIKREGKLFVEGETTEYKIVEKVDETQFGKP